MEAYREILGKVEGLQRGFTSGTSALTAAKGAAQLLMGSLSEDLFVSVELKRGTVLSIPLEYARLSEEGAEAAVRKDSGDDDDVTHDHLFCARVSLTESPDIQIIGGQGVGKVTRKGLPLQVGDWAINPGPRKMIETNLKPLCPEGKGFLVEISVPEGEALARKTWNPRLGIEGGISIIGTSGIIEPRSEKAYKASLILTAKTIHALSEDNIYLSPGYVGEHFYRNIKGLDESVILNFGDAAGFALNQGASRHFGTVHLACHIGKMAKIAAGLFDTHCKMGDARLETVAALAAACGGDTQTINTLLDMRMAEEAVSLLQEKGLEKTFDLMASRTAWRVFKYWEKDHDILPELRIYVLNLEGQCLNSPESIQYRSSDL
jgi:cobalt-precorrin-5B (C1)-methyltransferase